MNRPIETETFTTGTRTILGTDFGVYDQIRRCQGQGQAHPTWTATWGICNGTAGGSQTFWTRKAALAYLGRNADEKGFTR